MNINFHFLGINAKEWNYWILLYLYVWLYIKLPHYFPKQLFCFIFLPSGYIYMIQFSISFPTFVVNTIFKVYFSHSNRFVVISFCCFNCIFFKYSVPLINVLLLLQYYSLHYYSCIITLRRFIPSSWLLFFKIVLDLQCLLSYHITFIIIMPMYKKIWLKFW